jgi:dienelactone hydrolase
MSLLLCLAGVVMAAQAEKPKHETLQATAAALVDALAKGDFKTAVKDFDKVMLEKLPADKLKDTWEKISKQVGPFQKRTALRSEKGGKHEMVLVTCQFEKLALDARVVFTEDGKITGLFFIPASSKDYQLPAYVRRDSFQEVELKVGEGSEWELPATLTLPKGKGPFRAIVLVHGSGPQDRDESILGNKPFRDLAWGLASRGIAVLRYDKRTRVHPAKLVALPKLGVKEEVIDDALAAVALLRKREEIDPKGVFLLGHSLGAMLAPRMGELDPQLAGLIILAGNTRPLEDVVLEQFTYIYSLTGPTDEEKADLEKIKKQVARVKDPKLSSETPRSELPLGASADYWRSLRDYHPAETAAKLRLPMLILQGERDYQVTMDDFTIWKKTLGQRKDVALKSYPKLNHLFMDGQGKARPEEYAKTGHVAQEVIDDIAGWVRKQSRAAQH